MEQVKDALKASIQLTKAQIAALSPEQRALFEKLGISVKSVKSKPPGSIEYTSDKKPKVKVAKRRPYILGQKIHCVLCNSDHEVFYSMQPTTKDDLPYLSSKLLEEPKDKTGILWEKKQVFSCHFCPSILCELPKEELVKMLITVSRAVGIKYHSIAQEILTDEITLTQSEREAKESRKPKKRRRRK